MLSVVVTYVLIDFIGNDKDLGVAFKHLSKGFQLFFAVHGPAGIVGARENHESASIGQCLIELFCCDLKLLIQASFWAHDHATSKAG